MLPIVYDGALEFLESEYFSAKETMLYCINHDVHNDMPNKLWESADWRKAVFGIKTVTKYDINAFFFQLIGTKILYVEWTNTTSALVCVFGTDDDGKLIYKLPLNWKGFKFISKGVRRTNSYAFFYYK